MGKDVKIRNPRTGEFDYQAEFINEQTLGAELQPLRATQKLWFGIGVAERAKHVVCFGAALKKYQNEIIEAMAQDTGRMRLCHMELEAFQHMAEEHSEQALKVLKKSSGVFPNDAEVSFEQQLVPCRAWEQGSETRM